AAVLRAARQMEQRGPGAAAQVFFDNFRAMLFYIDELLERQHHPKETEWLFPRLVDHSAEVADAIALLNGDHEGGEAAVRELQHLLLAWELLGEARRAAFASALLRYEDFYLAHMQLEESVVMPAALATLGPEDWQAIDRAFAANDLLLTPGVPREPELDALYTRIRGVLHGQGA
ncbi:MAG: hemerythrin domain-containing protein, partial [Giesbergeria sp.]